MTFLARLFAPFILVAHLFVPSPFIKTVDRVSASIVRITGKADEDWGPQGYSCSGFVIATNRVLTAAHCIMGKDLRADGVPLVVLISDTFYDLALVKVHTTKAPLALRDTMLARYEPVNALGYGYGFTRLTLTYQIPVLVAYQPTNGEESASDMAPGYWFEGGFIGGMSGGPVFDHDGLVVAMVQRGNEKTGYGVPVLLMRAFLLGADVG